MQQSEIQSIKQRYGIVGTAPQLDQAIDIAVQVASTDLSVLITGESGVGKENFPQIIHQHSYRKHNSYFAINCGAIPEGTIDSELFGHEKGAFTSASSDRKGYFEIANGGKDIPSHNEDDQHSNHAYQPAGRYTFKSLLHFLHALVHFRRIHNCPPIISTC